MKQGTKHERESFFFRFHEFEINFNSNKNLFLFSFSFISLSSFHITIDAIVFWCNISYSNFIIYENLNFILNDVMLYRIVKLCYINYL